MFAGTLRTAVDNLWEAFWTGGLGNPPTVFEQITEQLFLRRLDENQTLKEKQAAQFGGAIKDPIYTPSTRTCAGAATRTRTPTRSSPSPTGLMPGWMTSTCSTT